jgi:heterodisulfide reductase subunit A-like polyferredoxin
LGRKQPFLSEKGSRLASKKVCVVGAGISGISVANDLVQAGVDVFLVDKNPYPGGQSVFYGCKAADECVRCGVCLVREAVAALKNKTEAECRFSSHPVALRSGNGVLEIDIQSSANLIDWQACVECGRCVDACPEQAIEKVPGWKYFVNEKCTACGKCVDACPVGAISLKRPKEQTTMQVDGIVLAAGYQPFDPAINRKWGFGTNSRVLTGSQMETLLNPLLRREVPSGGGPERGICSMRGFPQHHGGGKTLQPGLLRLRPAHGRQTKAGAHRSEYRFLLHRHPAVREELRSILGSD